MPTEDRFDFLDLREQPATARELATDNTIANTCSHPSVNPCSDFCCPG